MIWKLLGNRWVIYGILAFVGVGLCCAKSYMWGSERYFKEKERQQAEATRIAGVRTQLVTEEVIKYIKVAGKTEIVTREVEKEVKVYANTTNCLDPEWRRLHDAAALNVAEPPAGTEPASGAPSAAESIATVTENYARCHRTADRLDAIQELWRKQSQVK